MHLGVFLAIHLRVVMTEDSSSMSVSLRIVSMSMSELTFPLAAIKQIIRITVLEFNLERTLTYVKVWL